MSKDLNISNPNNFTFDDNYAAAHEPINNSEGQNQANPNNSQESQDEINGHTNSQIILESQSHLINALNSISSDNNKTGKNLSQNSQIPINNSNIKNEDISKLVDMIKNNSSQISNNSQMNGIIPKIKELLLGKYIKILDSQNQQENKAEQKKKLENFFSNIDNNSNNSINDEINENLKAIINNTNQIIEANTLLSLVLLISNEGQEKVVAELKKSNDEQKQFNEMIKASLDEQKNVNSSMMGSINKALNYLINAKNGGEVKKKDNSDGQNGEEKK
jgi:hypothetical protein